VARPPEFDELRRKVRNWGRWGEDDELGTLNLITDEVVRRGAASVRTGKRFSLAVPLSEDGPQTGAIEGRVNPQRTMVAVNRPLGRAGPDFSDDAVTMGLQAATHWDALAHVSFEGRIYNGFPASAVDETGATRCGIDHVRTLAGVGVLLDVARAHGLERLDHGHAIGREDLDESERSAGITVEPGDIVLVRTGQMRLLREGDRRRYAHPSPGLGMESALWFRERDVAAVATDNLTLEVYPPERDDCPFPLHILHLVDMGLTQGQNWDLEALAEDCAADGRFEFLLEASPEPFVRGLGSPVNPVAIK